MANFHSTEMDVIRHAEANKLLEVSPGQQALFAADSMEDLCRFVALGEPVEISEQVGLVAIDMIRLCAMLDIDLSKCLAQAFEKISAKPLPSNVVFLKKE